MTQAPDSQIDELLAERAEYWNAFAEQILYAGGARTTSERSAKSVKVPDSPVVTDAVANALPSVFEFSPTYKTKRGYPGVSNLLLVTRVIVCVALVAPESFGLVKDAVDRLLNVEDSYSVDVEIV